jgi:hypothetical protein
MRPLGCASASYARWIAKISTSRDGASTCTLTEAFALRPAEDLGNQSRTDQKKACQPDVWSDLEGAEAARARDRAEAADGIRTHDLLHGKQTLVARSQHLGPANGPLLRPGDSSLIPQVSSRFDGVVSPNCPQTFQAPALIRTRFRILAVGRGTHGARAGCSRLRGGR